MCFPVPSKIRAALASFAAALVAACGQIPDGLQPVGGFDPGQYLGTWYEIARLDHGFERGLTRVTATYTARPDGGIDVVNRGYDPAGGEWREARGRARFVGPRDVASLEVSFFGPFYGGYNVIDLDPGYTIALVAGPTRGYLWILARSPAPPRPEVERLVARARSLGFDTDSLVYVDQH
ncbi:MAG: lipocalin family protein [Steroidobacteraceae bacterium]